jgi:hypothetical protein
MEVSRERYRVLLDNAMGVEADFLTLPPSISGSDALAILARA